MNQRVIINPTTDFTEVRLGKAKREHKQLNVRPSPDVWAQIDAICDLYPRDTFNRILTHALVVGIETLEAKPRNLPLHAAEANKEFRQLNLRLDVDTWEKLEALYNLYPDNTKNEVVLNVIDSGIAAIMSKVTPEHRAAAKALRSALNQLPKLE
ncbi:MAG TPA: hypothetical protein PLF01_02185 [Alphaproteobacteria bacterium]|nr:hypothetical protein [Alphaproteobacteria bacterium]